MYVYHKLFNYDYLNFFLCENFKKLIEIFTCNEYTITSIIHYKTKDICSFSSILKLYSVSYYMYLKDSHSL